MKVRTLAVLALVLSACGGSSGGGATPAAAALTVAPQNTTLLVGENRLGLALTEGKKPVLDAKASVTVVSGSTTVETVRVEFAGKEYRDIPYYLGAVSFPQQGLYHLVVHATLADGRQGSGSSDVLVTTHATELPIGFKVPALKQPIASDVGGKLAMLDSGVPPDDWHTATVADGLAQHRPMILYFGQPGRCATQTCGPTITVLQELCKTYCDKLLFEHIEVHYPASADTTNPAFAQLGFQSEPWVYFVNSQGVVADRYEGPVTLAQLQASAEGTLAGKVPAVSVTASSS
jgi:hypothetical protein